MAHAENQQVIANGQITLYLRDDVKTPQWQCRIKIKGHSGYVRRSTGETDLDRAKEVALQILGELNQRVTQNLPLKRKTFAEIAAAFLKDAETRWKEGRNSEGRYRILKGTIQRYLIPYFGNCDITLIQKKDLMAYRTWRQAYWVTGPGFQETGKAKKPPTQATLKQEWTALRGVLLHGVDLGVVPQNLIPALKHDKTKINKRPAFTADEYRQLWLFMRKWWRASSHPRIRKDRALLRDYVLIMTNSGLRKGEARNIKWRDVNTYRNQHGDWVTLTVTGKTGERLVVCQPGTERYFNRLRKRGYRTDPDDLVFCHEDGQPIEEWIGFSSLIKAAGLEKDTHGNKRTIYSLRHTYATLRLQNGTNVYWLKKNMGTSVAMIERHYGQTNVLVGIEHETAKRPKVPIQAQGTSASTKPEAIEQQINANEIVPIGAVDVTPSEEGDEED
ncbi:tyrosine-type recombinase/integrase [Methylocystis echinoides]|uniref:Site-specific recombinase phage integrase family protein n=1 Tax=Methylocystis echinoides TaxID=29468 RepID=A0A9W6LTD7_9HYPH|nr:tyrosine-type recombinase/integrase [Methylocystis echinoides]GLI94386.1 site-specific recombinase phage integrase family protein [Methylocystis echinoides]